eukprot:5409210-Pleurochrysis_carterae.AAC.1
MLSHPANHNKLLCLPATGRSLPCCSSFYEAGHNRAVPCAIGAVVMHCVPFFRSAPRPSRGRALLGAGGKAHQAVWRRGIAHRLRRRQASA